MSEPSSTSQRPAASPIKFLKAHGAGNDFLITPAESVAADDVPAMARAVCDRRRGVGADGWYLVEADAECDAAIHLYNSDGSPAELSGNGTRCVAAMLIDEEKAGDVVRIRTGAGVRELRLLWRHGREFRFEMGMGTPSVRNEDLRRQLPLATGSVEVTAVDVGNPQCAVFVDRFPDDWRSTAAEIESHPQFPHRTNVSFVRVVDRHTIEARFYERGAGETLSSGTGSTGAAAAAIARGAVDSPVKVRTAAGDLELRWEDEVFLQGPAVIVARGEWYP